MIRFQNSSHSSSCTSPTTILFLLIICTTTLAHAQDRVPEGEFQGRSSLITFEAMSTFGPDTSKASVDVFYRIPRNFFVFVRSNDPATPRNEFVARGQLQVELFNEQDVSVARDIRPIALRRMNPTHGDEQEGDLEGAMQFPLASGQLTIVFEVDDLESGRSFVDKKHSVKAQSVSFKSLDLSPPFFAAIDTSRSDTVRYSPFNHDNNVLYGNVHGGMVSQVYCPIGDTTLSIHWNLTGSVDNRSQEIKHLEGDRFDLKGGLLELKTKEGPVVFEAKPMEPSWKILYIPVPLELLEPGQYKLDLAATYGKEQFKHEIPFHVIWPSRPMSLMDWDIATEALRYIAKPQEMDKILSGSSEAGRAEFHAFWKRRDPDTTTAYNEIMVEYYRRVDEAIRQYSTVKELDGYRTDRGRIYILNGAPTHIERFVLPDQPTREVWTYANIKKQFVFTEKNKSGNYILTQSNNL